MPLPQIVLNPFPKLHSLVPKLLPFIIILLLVACIEPFTPEIETNAALLVVEGHISADINAYTIFLSRSQPLTSEGSIPESMAQVFVTDNNGNNFSFLEESSGEYKSDPGQFTGVPGNTYTLHIQTSDGTSYRSSPVLLKSTPDIDSIYYERELRITDQGETKDGLKILLDSSDPENKTKYYRFDWSSDYIIDVPYPSQWGYTLEKRAFLTQYFRTCYTSEVNKQVLVANTLQLSSDIVSKFELTYVNTDSYRLRSIYSILVRQYALDEPGYKYWQQLAETTESLGGLFDPIAQQVTGNMFNITTPDIPVLGYFDASTVTQKRLFIHRDELEELDFPQNDCTSMIDSVKNLDDLLLKLSWGRRIISLDDGGFPNLMVPEECADCRVLGTPQKPDFWPGE